MESFIQGGFDNFSFSLSGPPTDAFVRTNLSTSALRDGPYFCKYDNIGMTSLGILFFNETEDVIAADEEIGLSVTLNSPFYKHKDGVRTAFSLSGLNDIPYRYSQPRSVSGELYCRTDERPTLFGTVCDKG